MYSRHVCCVSADVPSFKELVVFQNVSFVINVSEIWEWRLLTSALHCSRPACQAEELEQTPSAKDRSSDNQGSTHLLSAPSHGSTETPAGGRGHTLHRMSPPQHPLSRPSGHPPRPFSGPSRGAGAASGSAGGGEGGMGALLGVASQLRPPRVSLFNSRGRISRSFRIWRTH